MLEEFLDIIFYTCGMTFHNTCNLVMAVSPKQPIEPNEHNNEISPEEEDYNNESEDLKDENEVLDNNTDSRTFFKSFC